jgi:hypothetical protein
MTRLTFLLLPYLTPICRRERRQPGVAGHPAVLGRHGAGSQSSRSGAFCAMQVLLAAVIFLIIDLQVRWLEAAAAQNHPDALYNMAVMHAYGHGGAPQDNQLARQYFERAAALDFAPAKNGLAMILSNTGGETEYREAFKLFNESAALGNSDGYYNKGILLRQGLGVEKDPVAARVALQAAADLGHPSACVTLAEMLITGEGGPDDHLGALVLLKHISGGFTHRTIRLSISLSFAQFFEQKWAKLAVHSTTASSLLLTTT